MSYREFLNNNQPMLEKQTESLSNLDTFTKQILIGYMKLIINYVMVVHLIIMKKES
jgi:hypothetical protein